MTIFFSASRCAFFNDANHAALPDDAIEITATRHRDLLDAQASGAVIMAGDDGRPKIHRMKVTVADERARLVRHAKAEAARRIEAVSPIWRQINDSRAATPEGAARFAAIDAVRVASDAIEAQIAVAKADALATIDITHHPLWPQER